jgi:ribosome-associated toxin RatA of RatAB toxin-antitoxin module
MRGGCGQWRNVHADQENLAAFNDDVGFLDIHPARTNGLDLPAFEDNTGLILVFNEVVVKGFFVDRDAHAATDPLKSLFYRIQERRSRMALVEKTVLIEQSAERMFELVDRCEDYPAFLPWCSTTEVKFRDAVKTVATLHINFHAVKSCFTTENTKEFPTLMKIRLVDGPFRRLEGSWRFKVLAENACKIEFQLHYEFSSKLFEKVIGPVFSHIANSFVDAFVQRANQIYGADHG